MRVKNYRPPIGETFGRLTVLDSFMLNGRRFCACVCECGRVTSVRAFHLKSGRIRSCGCGARQKK